MQRAGHVYGQITPLGTQGHGWQIQRVVDLRSRNVRPVRARHDIETTVCLVHGCEADPDGETGTEHRVSPAVTVLMPRKTDKPVDRINSLEESFGRHIGEVLTERIARPVPVAK